MKRMIHSGLATGAMFWMVAIGYAQAPELPQPTKQHELLSQFAGEWTVKTEAASAPGEEPFKCEGTESAKMVGGFWLVAQGQSSTEGMTMNSLLTLGYNPATKKYIPGDFSLFDRQHTLELRRHDGCQRQEIDARNERSLHAGSHQNRELS